MDRGDCNVCMRTNSNENGDPFRIDKYHCMVSALIHNEVVDRLKIME